MVLAGALSLQLPAKQVEEPRADLGYRPADAGVPKESRGDVHVPGDSLAVQRNPQLPLRLLRQECRRLSIAKVSLQLATQADSTVGSTIPRHFNG